MAESINPHNLREYATALAEGALDAAQAAETVRWMAEHPDMVKALEQEQLLLESVQRAVHGSTPAAPASLRAKVLALGPPAEQMPKPAAQSHGGYAPMLWWISAAACLLIGLGVGRYLLQPPSTHVVTTAEPVIPASLVAHASRVHADCSRLTRGLHNAPFPTDHSDLAESVRHDLRTVHPYPDLSAIGFEYQGAGPCAAPLEHTIHLLYRSTTSNAAISVFVQRNRGQFPMPADRLFSVAAPESPFPVFVWRTDQVVYFLIADDPKTEQQAISAIASAPASQPAPQ